MWLQVQGGQGPKQGIPTGRLGAAGNKGEMLGSGCMYMTQEILWGSLQAEW